MNKQYILSNQVNVYKDALKKAELRENALKKQITEMAEERAALIVSNMKLSQEIDNLRDLKSESKQTCRKRNNHVDQYQTIQQMKSELWPDESRINAIGQNGNTGEHYEHRLGGNESRKYRLFYDGVEFAYNTAKELAGLMYEKCNHIKNPYEPHTDEYEDFNETIYSLQNDKRN